jgi:L-lactate dehydrogenase complex protein LldG
VEECLHWQPIELSSVKRFVVKGDIGVAESGAIWVSEESMKVRLLPFVCEQLYIVLYENDLVFDLEEAYERIGILKDGYGVFIAGPSKTADIEQSLVIGAHGPIGLTVLFIKKEIELL